MCGFGGSGGIHVRPRAEAVVGLVRAGAVAGARAGGCSRGSAYILLQGQGQVAATSREPPPPLLLASKALTRRGLRSHTM